MVDDISDVIFGGANKTAFIAWKPRAVRCPGEEPSAIDLDEVDLFVHGRPATLPRASRHRARLVSFSRYLLGFSQLDRAQRCRFDRVHQAGSQAASFEGVDAGDRCAPGAGDGVF